MSCYLKLYVRLIAVVLMMFVTAASTAFAQVIDQEDFGTGAFPGAPLPPGQTSYIYNVPAQPANFPDILDDGEYVIATDSQQGFTSWASIGDNTTGTGYMMLVNADDNQSGEFYRRRVNLTSNTTYDFLTYLVNVNSQGDFDFCEANEGGLVLPNVTLQVESVAGAILASFDTGDIPFNPVPEWEEYRLVFSTDAATTEVDVVLINNSLGGCGNDLALDDITFRVAVTMEAFDDSATVTDTTTQNAALSLGGNDTLNGNPVPGTVLYDVADGSSLPAGLTLNTSTGEVSVAAGTPEGTLSFDYQVCETVNEFNCDIATATVIIDFPPAVISAENDIGSVADSSQGFTPVLNVLNNDTIDGVSPPDEFTLSLSAGQTLPSGLTFNTNTGAVGVLQGSSTGVLSFNYDICEAGDPSNCETATVTIDVTNPGGVGFCPAGTALVTGTFNVVSATGGNNPERAVGTPLPEGSIESGNNSAVTFFGAITMDLTGDESTLVPEGEVIDIVLSSRFSTNARAEILMSADGTNYTSLGTTGNGGSVYGAWASNTLRYDDFTVPAGGARFLQVLREAAGVIADGVIYNTQCQPAPVTVTAADDEETVQQSADAQLAVLNVIDNDTFDGLTPSDFDLSVNTSSTLPAELTFDLATGDIGVVADAPEGVYSFDYDICEPSTTNCDTATVTITVEALLLLPDINVVKSVLVYDPNNAGLYAIPGNDVIYTINVENNGAGDVDEDTLLLIDIMPSELGFYNSDIDDVSGPESDPVAFIDNGSSLSFSFGTDVGFSNSATRPATFGECNYSPTAGDYDFAVTFICFNPKGAMLAGSSWLVRFRARIE